MKTEIVEGPQSIRGWSLEVVFHQGHGTHVVNAVMNCGADHPLCNVKYFAPTPSEIMDLSQFDSAVHREVDDLVLRIKTGDPLRWDTFIKRLGILTDPHTAIRIGRSALSKEELGLLIVEASMGKKPTSLGIEMLAVCRELEYVETSQLYRPHDPNASNGGTGYLVDISGYLKEANANIDAAMQTVVLGDRLTDSEVESLNQLIENARILRDAYITRARGYISNTVLAKTFGLSEARISQIQNSRETC